MQLQQMPLYLQEGQERRLRELQAGQPHHNTWEGDGTINLGNHFQTHKGQKRDWEKSAWIHKGEVMLHERGSLL